MLGLGERVSSVNLRLADRAQVDAVARQLTPLLAQRGLVASTWPQLLPRVADMVGLVRAIRTVIVAVFFLVVALAVMNTVFMAVAERTREFGVMMALGTPPDAIVRMVVYETVALMLLASVVGYAVGCGHRLAVRQRRAGPVALLQGLQRDSRADRHRLPAARCGEPDRARHRPVPGQRRGVALPAVTGRTARPDGGDPPHVMTLDAMLPARFAGTIMLVAALLASARPAQAEGLGLTGSVKSLFVRSRTVNGRSVRAEPEPAARRGQGRPRPGSRARPAVRQRTAAGQLPGHGGVSCRSRISVTPQYWRADANYVERGDVYGRHRLYRAAVTLTRGDVDLKLGRQRIAWGTGRFWSPLDILNPVSPLALEREERVGVDAALLEAKLGPLSRASLVYAPAPDRGPRQPRAAVARQRGRRRRVAGRRPAAGAGHRRHGCRQPDR